MMNKVMPKVLAYQSRVISISDFNLESEGFYFKGKPVMSCKHGAFGFVFPVESGKVAKVIEFKKRGTLKSFLLECEMHQAITEQAPDTAPRLYYTSHKDHPLFLKEEEAQAFLDKLKKHSDDLFVDGEHDSLKMKLVTSQKDTCFSVEEIYDLQLALKSLRFVSPELGGELAPILKELRGNFGVLVMEKFEENFDQVSSRFRSGASDVEALMYCNMLEFLKRVETLHGLGIVHRDIKGANILLGDRVVLADFGLSKNVSSLVDGSERRFNLAGTRCFLKPQLVEHYLLKEKRDSLSKEVQADVYAVAVVVFHVITGKYPLTDHLPVDDGSQGSSDEVLQVISRGYERSVLGATLTSAGCEPRLKEVLASILSEEATEELCSIKGLIECLESLPTHKLRCNTSL